MNVRVNTMSNGAAMHTTNIPHKMGRYVVNLARASRSLAFEEPKYAWNMDSTE